MYVFQFTYLRVYLWLYILCMINASVQIEIVICNVYEKGNDYGLVVGNMLVPLQLFIVLIVAQ